MMDAAERLITMAERIRRNAPEEFAGCVVVLPPEGENGQAAGDPIEILLIDPKQDRRGRNFWATAKAEVELGEHHYNQQQDQAQRGFR